MDEPQDDRPRGIRNNNPGNIEYTPRNDWHGQVGSDGRFAIFAEPKWGIRAIAKILASYQRRGKNTVEAIITTWAPAHENDCKAYVDSVCQRTGLFQNFIVTPDDWPALIAAIIHHENGEQPYTAEAIAEGIRLASR